MLAHDQLVQILAALPDPAFILTRSGRYAGVFGGTDSRYYHDGSGLIGKSIGDVLETEKTNWFLAEIDKALQARKLHIVEYGLAGSDVKGIPADGPQYVIHFEGRVQPLNFQVEGEDAVLWVASNITERHALEERLRALSETDALTGLWNRRHFEKIVATEKERALRYGHPISLLIFDIDLFKLINDTYGHKAGDAVLVELAKVIGDCTRESDIVTRWGGEEFTILMPYAELEAAAEAAEKIRHVVEAHPFPHCQYVTISLGVAEWSLASESFDVLLSRADDALYKAKNGGRNRSVLSRPAPLSAAGGPSPTAVNLLWRTHYESGNETIDGDHQSLIDSANAILARVAAKPEGGFSDNDRREIIDLIDRFLSDTRSHFEREELKLAEIGWDGLPEHRSEHQRLSHAADVLRDKLSNSPTDIAIGEFIDFLTIEVVANHIIRADRMYFSLLR